MRLLHTMLRVGNLEASIDFYTILLGIGVDDVYSICESIEQQGGDLYRKPGPVKGGKSVIAFVRNPDGYAIELIER
jgi:lactoylglutathione lyase